MLIPFKVGLSDRQRASIEKMVSEKAVSIWSDSDKANWAYATNNAPYPVKSERSLFVDLGHSAKFPGASGVIPEIAWNRSIWASLKGRLNKVKWNVVLVPDSYGWLDLTSNGNLINRIKYINSNCKDGDFVLSIHGNAASNATVRGVTTCYMGGSEYMRRLAVNLSQSYAHETGVPVWGDGSFDDRLGRFGRIGMCRDTRPPALLIEAGFVTNVKDMSIRPEMAAKVIANWFNTSI